MHNTSTYQSLIFKYERLERDYGILVHKWHSPAGVYFCYGGNINIKKKKNSLHVIVDSLFSYLDHLKDTFNFNVEKEKWNWVLLDSDMLNAHGYSTLPYVGYRGQPRNDRYFNIELSIAKLEYYDDMKLYYRDALNYLVGWKLFNPKKSREDNRLSLTAALLGHEFGHLLSKPKHLKSAQRFLNMYPYAWWVNNISKYGYKNKYEAVAEIFGAVTARTYKWGSLPEEFEAMVLDMLSCKRSKKLCFL